MSVRFTAENTFVAPPTTTSSNSYLSQSRQVYHHKRRNIDDDDDSSMSSNIAETRALMNNNHQGRHLEPGTPDANTASSMSSDINNNNNNNYNINATSQAAPFYNNVTATSTQDLFIQFHEALALEPKYQPNLFLPQQSNVSFDQ